MIFHARHRAFCSLFVALAGVAACSSCATSNPDRLLVVDTVQRFFDAMADRDVKTSREVLVPEGVFVSIRTEDGTRLLRHFTNAAYLERLATRTGDVLERMNDPIVLIEGDVATVWSEYEFLKDGKLSHTGFDAFNLIRTDDGWKITGGAYTVLPVHDN